jgi:hypothetical protein
MTELRGGRLIEGIESEIFNARFVNCKNKLNKKEYDKIDANETSL